MSSHGGSGAKRKAAHHEEEEHENHERWLVSYADMMTLLMCLFIVLFAMSQVDSKKFAELASGLAQSFGTPITALTDSGASSNAGVLDALPDPIDVTDHADPSAGPSEQQVQAAEARAAVQDARQTQQQAKASYDQLVAAEHALQQSLQASGHADAARFTIDERGLTVHVVADEVLFGAESAQLRPEGVQVLDAMAPTLRDLPNQLRVEGHTNSVPVTPGGPWPSNWELSTYRATTVLRHLSGTGRVPERRLSAVGYADTQPLVPDTDPTALTVNRRVDIVVLSTASAEANALLPGLAAADPTQEHTP